MKQPMTVGQFIERLKSFDQDAFVMLDCEDDYFSGPLSGRIKEGLAYEIGPHDCDIPKELRDTRRAVAHYPGGWASTDLDGDRPDGPVLTMRKCIRVRAR